MNKMLEEIRLSRALATAVYNALQSNEDLPAEVKQAYYDLQRVYDRQIQEEGV